MADTQVDDWTTAVTAHVDKLRLDENKTAETNGAAGDNKNPPDTKEKTDLAEESLLSKLIASKLRELKTDEIDVQQKDPNNPLFSAKTFEELNLSEPLLKGLRAMQFMKPSRIQETALPLLLKNPPENMIAQSQSGTGKTAAFSLICLTRIDVNNKEPQALILSPTYELALQTGAVIEKMGQFLGADQLVQYGTKANKLERGSKVKAPVIIGTPGTILDWIVKFKFFDPKKIKILVFDEADVMISTQGHKDQSTRIKRSLNTNACQSLLFSATYDNTVLKFAKAIVKDANIITLKREQESLENIIQYYVKAPNDQAKLQSLFNIYAILDGGQAVIFCRTRDTAQLVANKMNDAGFAVAMLTGKLDVADRAKIIKRFQEGLERVLITTNVTARGIDVDQVTMVVNYDLPDQTNSKNGPREADCETYLHRIGRTGRFGKTGIAINMVETPDDLRLLQDIEKHFNRKIPELDAQDIDDLEQKLVD